MKIIHTVLRTFLEGNNLLPWTQHSKTAQPECQERWVIEGAQLALIRPRTQCRLHLPGACGSETSGHTTEATVIFAANLSTCVCATSGEAKLLPIKLHSLSSDGLKPQGVG